MSKILFVTWPGGGNQPPAIGLAQQLRRDGHDTLFAGYIDQASRFKLSSLTSHARPLRPVGVLRPLRSPAVADQARLGVSGPCCRYR